MNVELKSISEREHKMVLRKGSLKDHYSELEKECDYTKNTDIIMDENNSFQ